MRHSILFALIVGLAGCGSSTEPNKAGDPSLLFTNNLDSSWVYITWQDGQGIIGRDSVAPRTASQCVRFTAQPDSAYWSASASDEGKPSSTSYPWFNPTDRPAWKVVVSPRPGQSPGIFTTLADTPC